MELALLTFVPTIPFSRPFLHAIDSPQNLFSAGDIFLTYPTLFPYLFSYFPPPFFGGPTISIFLTPVKFFFLEAPSLGFKFPTLHR